ncbi:hypothetical protein HMPREF1146_2466 [Prevotella sp. MSX73]|uniref:Uncharacterized protein n=1 Tax=Segatella buccae ATCC 33574 TaxID=873513 RepID=E6K3M6_9BACT|nr:hypothetical protein HMPREF0649_01075 [Segatella buccae D17]EFU31794.1 hypothetical protein HMPREF6485_0179 [Segatella buccae ATCC 33574]EJP27855.1 hypothetical protein HMPREF1146_2466 [Prevotella sp. MSX73]
MIDIAQEIVIYPTKSNPLTFILPFPTHHIKLLCKFATNKKSYLKEREQGISTSRFFISNYSSSRTHVLR